MQFSILADKAIKLIPTPLTQDTPVISKFGGKPAIPSLDKWPLQENGKPLSFVGQINFAEISKKTTETTKNIFPEQGILMFFLDIENMFKTANYYKFIYNNKDLGDSSSFEIPTQKLKVKTTSLLAEICDSYPRRLDLSALSKLKIKPEELKAEIRFDYEDHYPRPFNQLLGHPFAIQDDPLWNVLDQLKLLPQFPPFIPNLSDSERQKMKEQWDKVSNDRLEVFNQLSKDWILLWQIPSDGEIFSTYFADDGIFYLYIEKTKLQQGDFSNLQLVLQS